MSDDPETARQIAELARDTRPLLVIDVDDVVLEFVRPFMRFLEADGHELRLQSFKLHGNVFHRETGMAAEREHVSAYIDGFFAVQGEWQTLSEGVSEALQAIAGEAEIVMLTAMPHKHREVRRTLLDRLALPYPLLTTETPKGPAIRMLRGEHPRPVAFVDDLPANLISVREAVGDASLFHLTAMPELRRFLPPLGEGIETVETWAEAAPKIAKALGINLKLQVSPRS